MYVDFEFNDEKFNEPPGMESVVINFHINPNDIRPNMKTFEFLPKLLYALGLMTYDPFVTLENQNLLEICRQQIISSLKKGSELPPMRFTVEKENLQNAILRVQFYIPRIVTNCAHGISLANEIANHRW